MADQYNPPGDHVDPARPVDGLSAAPGTPQTATKAVVAAIVSLLGAAVLTLLTYVTGDETLSDVTFGEWLAVAAGVLAVGGATGGAVFQAVNKPKRVGV